MVMRGHIDALLADLGTIIDIASAGVLSKSESRLQAGEVRPAAIMFIDIAGFSELSRKLDPEQLTKLIDSSFRIFELTAKSHGGYLDKVIGDAALYVFAGHPNHAPPCEAALAAALKIQDRARQITNSLRTLGLELPVRCGVSFGEVARQAVGGEDVQVTVMGDTVNLAQRLETAAELGSVYTHEAVISKAGSFFAYE
ncbi:MAG TPA: adenylate/guanylate cyclase domain-containing protein, partial [Firmicutes bacterium]|nr:adenylate/guanylate cyclase domain-containing protein [Bacillota bacterium]